jgi:hypothetical protein
MMVNSSAQRLFSKTVVVLSLAGLVTTTNDTPPAAVANTKQVVLMPSVALEDQLMGIATVERAK